MITLTDEQRKALGMFCQCMAYREGEDVLGVFMKTGVFHITEVVPLANLIELTEEEKKQYFPQKFAIPQTEA